MTHTESVLQIDQHFQRLIPPLSEQERRELEQSILSDGCRDPICVWNDVILDGHNRYEICCRYQLSFKVLSIPIRTREEAISWICANQLGRRNISEETRKYLIGKRYQAEKQMSKIGNLHKNQNPPNPKVWDLENGIDNQGDFRTSVLIGKEYQISHSSVENYGRYSAALDNLSKTAPEVVPQILTGNIKISCGKVVELSKLPPRSVQKVFQGIEGKSREETTRFFKRLNKPENTKQKSIKDMPDYDPDSEVSSLTLTLPSWRNTLHRTIKALQTNPVTPGAKKKLRDEIQTLIDPIAELMAATMKGKTRDAK